MNSVLCVWGYSGPSFCSSGIPYLPKANWGRLQNRDIPCLERSKDSHFATCLGCSSNTNFFSESSNSCFLYFVQGLKACLVCLACLLLKLTAVPFPAQCCSVVSFAFLHLIPQLSLKQSVSFVDVKTEAGRDNKKLI